MSFCWLRFNDPSDYASVIPGVRKKEPSKAFGRGLISLDAIFEFQTAYVYKEEKMTDYIKVVCEKLDKVCSYKATKIPILPEVVNQEFVQEYLGTLKNIPVGVGKETLITETIDLSNKFIYNITGDDITTDPQFIRGLTRNLLTIPNTEVIMFDANSVLTGLEYSNGKIWKKIFLSEFWRDSVAPHFFYCFYVFAFLNG